MRVGVVGTGYVGLVSGTCFAELGNDVVCVDNNPEKVAMMQEGTIPIYEPGLEDLFHRNIREGRLTFTTDLRDVLGASAIFLALPTPPGEDGSADLSYIMGVAEDLGEILTEPTVVVNKSTVPVGTAQKVRDAIAAKTSVTVDVVSNPEFLREGQAVNDFMRPDRVVIGSDSERATAVLRKLYEPTVRQNPDRIQVTDPASSETIKYAANGFLATKITFINELTAFCEATGADVNAVRRGMGMDKRIGPEFLYPGPGYGGSCFPKDTLALREMAASHGVELRIVDATIQANEAQKKRVPEKVLEYFEGDVKGRTFALWGLAFKDNTDDIRESPALVIAQTLMDAGAHVAAFDPEAIANVRRLYEGDDRISFGDTEYDVLKDADALIVATNWREFFGPDWNRVKELLSAPVIFDGRNLYGPSEMAEEGFYYASLGRKAVDPYV